MSISLRQRQQGLQASPAAPFVVIFGGVRSPEQPTVVAEKDRFFFVFVIHCERDEEKRSARSNTAYGKSARSRPRNGTQVEFRGVRVCFGSEAAP